MKRLILVFFLGMTIHLFAQANSLSLKAGYYFPADLKPGGVYGIDYGLRIDESVRLLVSGDFYYKSIRDDVNYGEAEELGVQIEQGEHLSQWVGWHLPLTLKAQIEIPSGHGRIRPFASAGLGYGLTHVSYEKYSSNSSAAMTYGGFVWQLGGGVLIGLGSRSDFQIELLYNGASFEKNVSASKFTTLNSSGLILRGGLSLDI